MSTYIIEGQGKGNVENVTPTTLVKISGNGGGSSGGDSNLTLEQARQNGNVLEGSVEVLDNVVNIGQNIDSEIDKLDGISSYVNFNGGNGSTVIISKNINDNTAVSLGVSQSDVEINSTHPDSKGLVGNREFNKQGERKAFAQLSDVYDAISYSTNEIKTGGTWIDGKPIYRRVFYDTLSGGTPVGNGYILTKIIDINIEKIVTSQIEFINSGGGILRNPSSIQILKDLSSSPYIIQYTLSSSSGFYELILEYTKQD